jgi:hypothetical protein
MVRCLHDTNHLGAALVEPEVVLLRIADEFPVVGEMAAVAVAEVIEHCAQRHTLPRGKRIGRESVVKNQWSNSCDDRIADELVHFK